MTWPTAQDPLSLDDRACIRRMMARSEREPTVALSYPLIVAARYETALTALEKRFELLAIANGAKAVALDEIRQRVASGEW